MNRVRLASAFSGIRKTLLGRIVTVQEMAERGYGPSNKGRFGLYVNTLVHGDLGITVRTTAVRDGIEFVEDLLVCRQTADAVAALDRMILVCVRRMIPGAPPELEDREIVDVVYLAPPRIAVHALRRDVELLERRATGAMTDTPMFLTLKSHGQKAGTSISYYIHRPAVATYVRLLQNQPL